MVEDFGLEIRLAKRPKGLPALRDFSIARVPRPRAAAGHFVARNLWMSVDPYMRSRMNPGPSYMPCFKVGKPLEGNCVARVIESRHPAFKEGDLVGSMAGWRDFWVSDGAGVFRIEPDGLPLSTYLSALGFTGFTAYLGIEKLASLKGSENVFVSAATGAVGAIAAQLAKLKGCRVTGSAGSDAKARWLIDELGLADSFNYKKCASLSDRLARSFPEGIDLYFDNVGGPTLEAAIDRMKAHGRIVVSGMISGYNAPADPSPPRNLFKVVAKRLSMQGFLVTDHVELFPEFLGHMKPLIRDGRLRWKETVVEGVRQAPQAFIDLFRGKNFGKMLVRLSAE